MSSALSSGTGSFLPNLNAGERIEIFGLFQRGVSPYITLTREVNLYTHSSAEEIESNCVIGRVG